MPRTLWQLFQSGPSAGNEKEEVRLYGRLSHYNGEYLLGTRKEINRDNIARLREQIRMQDNFTGQIHDLRESIAGDNQNLLNNVTKMRTTLADARADLVKSRRPRSSYVYSAAMKQKNKGNSAVAKHLVRAYEAKSGSLGRVPDVQLYSILAEIDREMPGLFQVGPDGTISVVDAKKSGIGGSEHVALTTMTNLANEAQRAYVSEQRAIDQTLIDFESRASNTDLSRDQRAILATELHRHLDTLVPNLMASEGLISKEAAKGALQKIEEEDAHYRESFATQKFLGAQIRGGAAGDPLRAAMKKAMSNENFLAWAEENGFDNLGAVQPDGAYVEGKQDMRAMMAFRRQTQKPNKYGRVGSPGATTGEFVTFEVKLSPDDALRMKTDQGYAYVVDAKTGIRRGISPAAASKLSEQAQPGLTQVDFLGKVGFFDPSANEFYVPLTAGGFQKMTMSQVASKAVPIKFDVGAMLEAGQVVLTANGKPATAADLVEGALPEGATVVLREEWHASRPEVKYDENPPQTYWESGEKMKRQGAHEINPELDDGYIEVLTPSGKHLFKADQLVGPVTVTAARSGTTMADVMWQRRGAWQRSLPVQEGPMAAPRSGRMLGSIPVQLIFDPEKVRTNSTDKAWATGYGRHTWRDDYKSRVAAREEEEANAAAAARVAEGEQKEQLELSKELADLAAAADSSYGGKVEQLVQEIDEKTGAVIGTSLEPVHLTQKQAQERLAKHGERLADQEAANKARDERAAAGIAADEATARAAVEAAERGEDIEFELDEDELEPLEDSEKRAEERRAAAVKAYADQKAKQAEERLAKGEPQGDLDLDEDEDEDELGLHTLAETTEEKTFTENGYTWKVQVDEDGKIVGTTAQFSTDKGDNWSIDTDITGYKDDLQSKYEGSLEYTAPAPAAPPPAEAPPTPETKVKAKAEPSKKDKRRAAIRKALSPRLKKAIGMAEAQERKAQSFAERFGDDRLLKMQAQKLEALEETTKEGGIKGARARKEKAKAYVDDPVDDPVAELGSGMSRSEVPGRDLGVVAQFREDHNKPKVG